MVILNDDILKKYGIFKDNQYIIYSPDYNTRFFVKRIDNVKFSLTLKRNNSKIFLRYITNLEQLELIYKSIFDKDLNEINCNADNSLDIDLIALI